MNDAPLTWNPDRSAPRLTLPKGATDTHVHVFGPIARFPYAPESRFRPGDAPKEALFRLHADLGIERCVIVQSGCHGFDNAAVADAIAAKPGTYLGVALAPPDLPDNRIDALTAQGFRAIRFNYMGHLAPGATMDQLRVLAPRLADHGWHLLIHMEDRLIAEIGETLRALPCPVVIDHMGRVDASKGMGQPAFDALRRLGEHGNIWLKVSGSERCSRLDPPYADATPLARQLVTDFPDRVLWGTDWPHPNFRADPPDDGILVDLLAEICPDDAALHRLLVDNPQRLYRFGETP